VYDCLSDVCLSGALIGGKVAFILCVDLGLVTSTDHSCLSYIFAAYISFISQSSKKKLTHFPFMIFHTHNMFLNPDIEPLLERQVLLC
jgi:hypothetical protein